MFRYEEIAEDLQKKIKDGVYKTSEKLPKEYELCDQYETSRTTIREAMQLLENRGLIFKRRGSGSYVKSISEEEEVRKGFLQSSQFSGFTKDMGEQKVSSQIIEFAVVNPPREIAAALKMSVEDFAYYVCRIRLVDGEPFVVEYTYMPIQVISGVTKDTVQKSIYAHIENVLRLKIRSCHRIAKAMMPTEKETEWLAIDDGSVCILAIEQVAYLDDGRIFEYSVSHHRSDKFELKTITIR
ncbi:GntR family transcriptional regulator [Chakrabartyella piscis]|uniref:GntR family transcriptional regulator n=1 Tax=Chakrabartyella piscis TaxID=2918914 RepID=UPI0029587227|nr:GntR family transcriptional regulator [Chakrabartyella piscis]